MLAPLRSESLEAFSDAARGAGRRAIRSLGNDAGVFEVGCLAIGVAMRLLWVLLVAPAPAHDAMWYVGKASEMAQGLGYSEDGLPTAYWPVGYVAFLAALFVVTGPGLGIARLANVVLSSVSLILVYRLTHRFTASPIAARAALLMLSLYPADIGFCSLAVSEPLFVTLTLLATEVLAARAGSRQAALAGVLFGLATLTRAHGLPLAIAVVSLLPGCTRRRLGMVLGACALTMVPWVARNFVAFGELVPISNNGGVALYIGNNPHATGRYGFGPKVRRALLEGRRWLGGPREAEVNRRGVALSIAHVSNHPWAVLKLWPHKLRYQFAGDSEFLWWSRSVEPSIRAWFPKLKPVFQAYYWTLCSVALCGLLILVAGVEPRWIGRAFGAALVGATAALQWYTLALVLLATLFWRLRRPFEAPRALWLPAAVVAYFVVTTLVFFGSERFHQPVVPWLVMCAGYGLGLVFKQPVEHSPSLHQEC